MRIAPRTMLCGIAFRVHEHVAGDRFGELRELCTAAGDKTSLAIAMAGLVIDHAYQSRMRQASQLASEAWALIESLGDPTLTVGLSFPLVYAKAESGEWSDVLRWSQRVIDLADGDPSRGNFIVGSPLAAALTTRAIARYYLGRPGWREDLPYGLAMARGADPVSYAAVVAYVYWPGIPAGALRPDDFAMREIEDALQAAERTGDDVTLTHDRLTLGVALVHRHNDAERDRGQKLLSEVSEVLLRRDTSWAIDRSSRCTRRVRGLGVETAMGPFRSCGPPSTICSARDSCWRGGFQRRVFWWRHLLDRASDDDVAEAEAAIERLASAPAGDRFVARDIWLLRLRALLARAHGDDAAYAHFRDRYCDMAKTLGFEGHIAWAEAMP